MKKHRFQKKCCNVFICNVNTISKIKKNFENEIVFDIMLFVINDDEKWFVRFKFFKKRQR